jgi:hypothetical protein
VYSDTGYIAQYTIRISVDWKKFFSFRFRSDEKMKKFKSLCAITLFICLMAGSAFAADFTWNAATGDWSVGANWAGGVKPDGTQNVTIALSGSLCTLNTNEGGWEASDKTLDVAHGAKLIIASGGVVKPARVQVGNATGAGYVEQTSGTLSVYKDKLYVGRFAGSAGSIYTISGGTITYNGSEAYLYVGCEGGDGKFTVAGKGSTILLRKLYIGAHSDGTIPGTGTLEFKIGSSGVTPIQMTDNIYIDSAGAASTANLIVSATAPPPMANILLAEDMGGGTTSGTFDTVNGNAAPEGASVVLSWAEVNYYYTLTYAGKGSGDTNNNDVMLLYVPEPATLALLSLGLIVIRRNKK